MRPVPRQDVHGSGGRRDRGLRGRARLDAYRGPQGEADKRSHRASAPLAKRAVRSRDGAGRGARWTPRPTLARWPEMGAIRLAGGLCDSLA